MMFDDLNLGELGEFIIIQNASESQEKYIHPKEMEGTSSLMTTQFNWSQNHTKLFLDLYKKYKPKVGTSQIKTLKKLWEILALELNKILKTNITPGHCENRWRVLERAYKKHVDTMNKTGQGRKFFEYTDEMDEIFKGKRNVKPTILLSSTTVDAMPQDEDADVDQEIIEPSTSKTALETPARHENQNKIKRKTPVVNRNLTLASMKKDKKEYYEERLKIEREKIELQKEKLKVMKERNILCKERNEILKNQK
ncbi:unnamed protein product [Ceutorhynchus assimilis]|uniref:Myb/SANT-like DNA-binding domain-containing protein n=1 Tax=Ceutorhynchus assimilis TaxID=467358 RepID=A0A9P0DKH0_9CUCU|nr:unnamed protein product [Ceutorhynchus assimilis]